MKKDQQQLHQAILKYSDLLFRIAMTLLGKPEDAEDALQEAFLRYYRSAPDFQSADHEKAWLIRCVKNTAKDQQILRLRHAHSDLEALRHLAAPAAGGFPELLYFLSVSDRLLLQMKYIEGYSAEEIAALQGKTPAAVRKGLERARKRAQKIYEKEFVQNA